MKKLIALLYFMVGGSLIMFTLSLMGCEAGRYKFIYKIGQSIFLQTDQYNGQTTVTDTVQFENMILEQNLSYEILTAANLHLDNNTLYAWQYGNPSYTPVEKLTEIKIYTLNGYNSVYSTGSEITANCKFFTNNDDYNSNENDSSATWVLKQLNKTLSSSSIEGRPIYIFFTQPPSSGSLQQFEIDIRTENNEILRQTTPAIFIKP